MIFIEKTSKKSKRKRVYEMSPSSARLFLYSLSPKETNIYDYFILGSDKLHHLNELLAFFKPNFLEVKTQDIFTTYQINGNVSKRKRLRIQGANLSAIENFKTKIYAKFPHSSVKITYRNQDFTIQIDSPVSSVLMFCDYKLFILRAYALINKKHQKIDIKKNDGIVRIVNGIFRNQRYYYKKKGEKNVGKESREEISDSLSEIWD